MNVQTGVSSSQVLRGAGHIVYVEGGSDDAFDPTVIRELLKANGLIMTVHGLGACDNVVEAAKAMLWKHPSYYFLADRDGRDHAFVEHSWTHFIDDKTSNLIFWRKRELENYFIEPDYLCRSQFLNVTESELRKRILKEAKRRFYLEAANLVLLRIRSVVVTPPTAWFTQIEKFKNRQDALQELVNSPALQERGESIRDLLKTANRETMLDETLAMLSGGKAQLEYGTGEWLNLMSGKQIFRAVAGQVFRVTDASGQVLQGIEQNNEVAKDLLKRPLVEQPVDFQQVVALLQNKVAAHP